MKKTLLAILLSIASVANAAPPITWGSSGGSPAAKLFTNYLCFLDNTCYSSSSIGVAGSDKQVQFNDGGVQAGDSNLNWDKSNDALGIQTDTPLHALHVVGETGTSINSVVTASVTTASESLNASPTGSITKIEEFAASSGGSTAENTSGLGYSASGQTIDYRVYPALEVNGNFYKSQYFESLSYTDTSIDSHGFSVILNIGSGLSADVTHLYIDKQVNGGGFNDSIIIPVASSYEDGNFSGAASVNSWPTNYIFNFTTPTAASGPTTEQEVNVGFGNLTETGATYTWEIRAASSANGLYYCEQTGFTGNPFTDANAANTFDLQLDWAAGTGDEQVLRISTDSGSTWSYHFVGIGGTFTYSGQSSDTDAEAAWSRDASTAELEYAFKAFSINTAPSGALVYTPSADQYTATISQADANKYFIFKHSLTGFNTSAKIVADYNTSVTNGVVVSASTYYDIGYTTWSGGTTLTPTTYAFSSGTARYFKLVGTNGTIFSPTPLVVNATTSGSGKYFTGSFTYPSGVTTVKILLSTDGATYTSSRTFTSPTTTFTLDAADPSWTGNTTIAPTASVPSTARFDRSMTAVTDSPTIQVINTTGSGTRYSGIGFGQAASKSATSTLQTNILSEVATGYLRIGAARIAGYTGVTQTSQSFNLGNAFEYNLQKSQSVHHTFWGADASNPIAYFYSAGDSNRGTAYFGQSSTSFGGSSKVVIAPSAGGTTSLHLRHASGAGSTDAILIDEGGIYRGGWKKDGKLYAGVSAYDSGAVVTIGANSGTAHLKLNTNSNPATNEDGGIYFTTPTFFGTDGTTSRAFVRTSSTSLLTSGRVPFATTGGFLTDDADMTFSTDTLSVTKLNVGSGTAVSKILSNTATLDFTSISAQTCQDLTMTVTGAATGNVVDLGPPAAFESNLSATGFVSASNTVKVRVCNPTSGSIDPASATWRAMVTAF